MNFSVDKNKPKKRLSGKRNANSESVTRTICKQDRKTEQQKQKTGDRLSDSEAMTSSLMKVNDE